MSKRRSQSVYWRSLAARSAVGAPQRGVLSQRGFLVGFARLFFVSGVALSSSIAAATNEAAIPSQFPDQDRGYAIVTLHGAPLSINAATKPISGKKIDFQSSAVAAHRAALASSRNAYRRWLKLHVPAAKVTGEFDIAVNAIAVQLNGASLAQIAAMPTVRQATYQNLFYKIASDTATDPDLATAQLSAALRNQPVLTNGGVGVKVAIIDSGIDITHPCFNDRGYATHAQVGDPNFVNNKVIAARAFGHADNRGRVTPKPTDAHGTHISGTIACNAATTVTLGDATLTGKLSGVAPRALLGNYNIFPGDATKARTEHILHAMEAAYRDGFDVVNFSLAAGQRSGSGIEIRALRNLDQANMLFAVAPGGAGKFSDASNLNVDIAEAATLEGTPAATMISSSGVEFPGLPAAFGNVPPAGLAGPLSPVLAMRGDVTATGRLSTACSPLRRFSLTGSIALILRGGCDFTTKLRNVESAGAVAAIVVAGQGEALTVMAANDDAIQPTIPAFMLRADDQAALQANSGIATMLPGSTTDYQAVNARAEMFAGFSSLTAPVTDTLARPTATATSAATAGAWLVLSAVPASACAKPPCFAQMSGSSMMSAYLAGHAALLRAQHPAWSAAETRLAIVTAELVSVRNPVSTHGSSPGLSLASSQADVKDPLEAIKRDVATTTLIVRTEAAIVNLDKQTISQ